MTRDEKREYMRLWRRRRAKHLRAYERAHRIERNARARAKWRANRVAGAAKSARWRARNPTWASNHYRLNLSKYTGSGHWSTRNVRGRAAYRAWVAKLAANRHFPPANEGAR